MISCLLTKKDNTSIMRMFVKKARLQREALTDPLQHETHLRQRNLIIQFVLDKLGPALNARIKTWTSRRYCEEADAISLVHEHVVMAVDKYKPEKGKCTFTSFLWTVSNRAFSNHISASKRQKRDPQSANQAVSSGFSSEEPTSSSRFLVSLDESTSTSDDNSHQLTLGEIYADPKQIDDSLNFTTMLKVVYQHCSDHQKLILALLQQNYTYKEIASQLGTTPGAISREIQQLRRKLKSQFKDTTDIGW